MAKATGGPSLLIEGMTIKAAKGGLVVLAMFLDGDQKALRAYHAGDRESELVTLYFRRAALGFAAITESAG
jgi:hypothetical protein